MIITESSPQLRILHENLNEDIYFTIFYNIKEKEQNKKFFKENN